MASNLEFEKKEALLNYYKENRPTKLIEAYHELRNSVSQYADIFENPGAIFDPALRDFYVEYATKYATPMIEAAAMPDEMQLLESLDRPEVENTIVTTKEAHKQNMRQLLENSLFEGRIVNADNMSIQNLIPFDSFIPLIIARSYEPMVGKELIPSQTAPVPYVTIKEIRKYIVSKTGKKYPRPEVYSDRKSAREILNSSKGRPVTDKWYPAIMSDDGTKELEDDEVTADMLDAIDSLKIGNKDENKLDLLVESGGVREIGDSLDINVCVSQLQCVVTNSQGEKQIVTINDVNAYPDIGSLAKGSITIDVKIPIYNSNGEVESHVYDKVFGQYDAEYSTIILSSHFGYVKRAKFAGNLSNKNNYEFFSFLQDFTETRHPIPEGYSSQVPITTEMMQLYRETSNIDVVAYVMNEMTEIFTQLEDVEILAKIDEEKEKWEGKGSEIHPFERINGPVVITHECPIKHDASRLLKRNEYLQDEVNYHLDLLIADIRNILGPEPFYLRTFCHPNIAQMFVGDNYDWKITPGTNATEGIRSDFHMGIYTAGGNAMKLVTSQKFDEEDGIRMLVYPVSEKQFLTWRNYKYSMFFTREYHNPMMSLVPNFKGQDRFYTHAYIPIQAQLKITGYK